MARSGIDIQKIGTSALVGAAGGAAISSPLGLLGMAAGSTLGAVAVGYAEYNRERNRQIRAKNYSAKETAKSTHYH